MADSSLSRDASGNTVVSAEYLAAAVRLVFEAGGCPRSANGPKDQLNALFAAVDLHFMVRLGTNARSVTYVRL